MLTPRSSNEGSWGRRKGAFALSLTQINDDPQEKPARIVKKHTRRPSILTDPTSIQHPDLPRTSHDLRSAPVNGPESPRPRRPSASMRGNMKRPPSFFGSFRNPMRSSNDGAWEEPLSATPSLTPSFDSALDGIAAPRSAVYHGEVQTSAGLLRKRREYVVLTDNSIHRFKSQGKASEVFGCIPNPARKHGHMTSFGSSSDLGSLSESSGDREGRVPLKQVVAVQKVDDGKPHFAVEVSYLDEQGSNQASALTMQFNGPDERDRWLQHIREAVRAARVQDTNYISPTNLENAARVVERDHDYDPSNCAIFKIVQRHSAKSTGRSSSDDVANAVSTVCFLAVGVHKVHVVQPVKTVSRSSSPALAVPTTQASYGILSMTALKVSSQDDSFELTFRQPLQQPKTLYLASSTSHEIAARLHYVEKFLRPERNQSYYKFRVPPEVEELLVQPEPPLQDEHRGLDRTLSAYCVAYGVNPTKIRYSINYECEDGPQFQLLPASDTRRKDYGALDLLAVMRSLRYNDSFGAVSFAGVRLDSLHGLRDNHGYEHLCSKTKAGTPIQLSEEQLMKSCLLVQEVRALAACSKKLRRMDFSGCVTCKAVLHSNTEDEAARSKDVGCGIVEALFPLCKYQTTNVDWICLNGIQLTDADLDYLVGAAVDKSCHFRSIELNRCGLTDRALGLILDALRSQDNTLEAIEMAGNNARLNPVTFDAQLSMFGFIRKLDLSYVSRTSGSEPLLTAETLLMWRLEELKLTGTTLNSATVDVISTYLAHPQSDSLRELAIDRSYVCGGDIATLLSSMARAPGELRHLHFDISQNMLSKGIGEVTKMITRGMTPTHLTMRAIEYKEEPLFKKMLAALTVNKTIHFLDMAQSALPGDASEDTCRALERLLAENDTLVALDLSGEDSRLATTRFGPGINDALIGLKRNKTMQRFHIEKQKLGLQGASTLADVLKSNHALRELYCDNNEVPLQGLTDLVNSLVDNTSLIHLPTMSDGRESAFRAAEATMRTMAALPSPPPLFKTSSGSKTASSGAKRSLSQARRTVARAASSYTPSFKTADSNARSASSGESRSGSPLTFTLPVPKSKKSADSTTGSLVSFTVQDIQNTHRLLSEQWDRQCERLAQYLERNWCLMHNMPVYGEVDDTIESQRPESAGSINKVLQQVKFETTPRAEKPLYFDSPIDTTGSTSGSEPEDQPLTPEDISKSSVLDEKNQVSFKQFLLQSGRSSPDDDLADMEARVRELTCSTASDYFDEPRTPTQRAFTHA